LPLIGPEAFSTFSEGAKYVHNFVSFPFVLGLILIITIWMKDNVLRKVDVVWLKEGGGFIPSKHPTAGRFKRRREAGVLAGARCRPRSVGFRLSPAVSVLRDRHLWHADRPGGSRRHCGPVHRAHHRSHLHRNPGMEGAFEAMGTGSVDLNWAKEHHGLWLEEEIAKGRVSNLPASATPAE